MFRSLTKTAKITNKFYSTTVIKNAIPDYDYDYQYDCYETLDVCSNQYKYIGDIKSLKHFIDSNHNMYAYHPSEQLYEKVAVWDDMYKIPVTKNKQIYIPIIRNMNKRYFYDIDFLDTYTFSNCFNRILYVGSYDIKNDIILSHYK